MIPSALSPEDREASTPCFVSVNKFTLSGVLLNYSNTVDAALL